MFIFSPISVHSFSSGSFWEFYRESRSEEQLEDRQRQEHLRRSLERENKHAELVPVTNKRRYYTLSDLFLPGDEPGRQERRRARETREGRKRPQEQDSNNWRGGKSASALAEEVASYEPTWGECFAADLRARHRHRAERRHDN